MFNGLFALSRYARPRTGWGAAKDGDGGGSIDGARAAAGRAPQPVDGGDGARLCAPPRPASVLDVSAGGAMLRGDTHDLHKGDEIVLDAGRVAIVATVAWSNEGVFGLAFHRRLDAREMGWLKRTGRA